MFQFAYGSGTSKKSISTWSGYKDIPEGFGLPDDAKREAAFEAGAGDKDKDKATATPGASGTDATTGADPTNTADDTDQSRQRGRGWLWAVVIGLALAGSGAAAYVAYRRRDGATPGGHAGATTAPRADDEA